MQGGCRPGTPGHRHHDNVTQILFRQYLCISITEPHLGKEPILWRVLWSPYWASFLVVSLPELDRHRQEVVLLVLVEEAHSRGQLKFISVVLACRNALEDLVVHHEHFSSIEFSFERALRPAEM